MPPPHQLALLYPTLPARTFFHLQKPSASSQQSPPTSCFTVVQTQQSGHKHLETSCSTVVQTQSQHNHLQQASCSASDHHVALINYCHAPSSMHVHAHACIGHVLVLLCNHLSWTGWSKKRSSRCRLTSPGESTCLPVAHGEPCM